LLDRHEEGAPPIEVLRIAPEGRREIEAKTVDVHGLDPVAQAVEHELKRPGVA